MHTDIAHLGPNFWRKLRAKYPDYLQESHHAFLLCLDDDGHVLDYFSLSTKISRTSVAIGACIKLANFPTASTLVRIQIQSAKQKNPFDIESTHTKALYDAADLYGFHLAEVVLPRYTDVHKN